MSFEKNMNKLGEQLLTTLKSSNRTRPVDDINILEIYYERYKERPDLIRLEHKSGRSYYDWDKLDENLLKIFPNLEVCFQESEFDIESNKIIKIIKIIDFKNGVIGLYEGGIPELYFLKDSDIENVDNICSQVTLLSPIDIGTVTEEFIEAHKHNKIEESKEVTIGMICSDNQGYHIRDFDISDKIIDLKEFDLHYGDGFDNFNNQLLKKLDKNDKGLTLFHGTTGTGKTVYIKYLLKKLKEKNEKNNVLYLPPTMVEIITDPSFINFISSEFSESEGKNYIFIEDAEPLLESRESSRNLGITNLLNLTDGILNDLFNIQILVTFNTSLKNIDTALLRPERLTARKEFKPLTKESTEKLLKHLKIDNKKINQEMTVAEIYSLKNDSETLIHEVIENRKIGFGQN